jgi:hypothetical protein
MAAKTTCNAPPNTPTDAPNQFTTRDDVIPVHALPPPSNSPPLTSLPTVQLADLEYVAIDLVRDLTLKVYKFSRSSLPIQVQEKNVHVVPRMSFETTMILVNELIMSQGEFVLREKNRLTRQELVDASVSLGDVVLANQFSFGLLAKAQTFLHVAAAQTDEKNECCDRNIIITRFLNAVRTEILDECTNPNEPDNQDDWRNFETSERVDSDDEFDEFHTRDMKHCMNVRVQAISPSEFLSAQSDGDSLQPNKTVLNGLSKFGNGASALPNSAVIGAKPPGSSSVLASASCNH